MKLANVGGRASDGPLGPRPADVLAEWEEFPARVDLLPGDLIFTGTPSGVGMGRTPPVYLSR